ncbi:MAG: lamin tail domain-containing protein [Candidatus Pacebacteria bacterium]|nr:lamin tail domain-containing protein [Candidatus Paceibacterota bacterium]
MDNRVFFVASLMVLVPMKVFGANVVINEIAWMGQKDGTGKEWIEIYNPTEEEVSLENWTIRITKTEVSLQGLLSPQSYYLLERTDDFTVSEVSADLIFKKALSNKGEDIELLDPDNNSVDHVDCSKGWFAGDNKSKKTMERIDPSISSNTKSNWQTSQTPGGTPKEKNLIRQKEKSVASNNMNKENIVGMPSFSTYLTALLIAISSAFSVLAVRILGKN